MYAPYFQLSEPPFSIAPNPRYLYLSPQHQEALAHLLYGISVGGGFVVLTGEVGTGKTTLCRCLLDQLPEDVDLALIFNPRLNPRELLASICDELHIAYPEERASLKQLIDLLNRHLLEIHARGRRTIVLIDEAQNLSFEVLEQIRLLTNLETNHATLPHTSLPGGGQAINYPLRHGSAELAAAFATDFRAVSPASAEFPGNDGLHPASPGRQRRQRYAVQPAGGR
ncbi:MAG: AAA family ATPase [Methylocaldum sp.]|nr:AAA family ATPase [Methylocaldum sp.]